MRQAALRGLLLGLAFGTPNVSQALDWSTREVCEVNVLAVAPEAFEDGEYERIQEAAQAIANSNGKFWQITAPNGGVSHLWGTYHSSDPLILRLPDRVIGEIESAQLVATEIDFRPPSRAYMTQDPLWSLRYKRESTKYPDQPSGIDRRVLAWAAPRLLGNGYESLTDIWRYYTPAGAVEWLLTDPCNDFFGSTFSIQDNRILMLAEVAGVPTTGLEDPGDMLRKLSDPAHAETTAAMINVYASYLQPTEDNLGRQTSFALYRQGRIGEMIAWERSYIHDVFGVQAGDRYLKQTDDYLLSERNQNFLDRISPNLKNGGVFMAVGAFHLPGQAGLVTMLRDRGYRVTRIALAEES